MTENKSGVLVEAQSQTLIIIAKSQTFQIYPHSLNSALFQANQCFFQISFNWENHSSTVKSKSKTHKYSSKKLETIHISNSVNFWNSSSQLFIFSFTDSINFSYSESKKNLNWVSTSLNVVNLFGSFGVCLSISSADFV